MIEEKGITETWGIFSTNHFSMDGGVVGWVWRVEYHNPNQVRSTRRQLNISNFKAGNSKISMILR